MQNANPNVNRIHFLHIGKNAGTQLSNIARQINSQSKKSVILQHGHNTYLKDIPEGENYFFSIRNPISRFRSGFYSRKRKGQPRTYNEWSKYDKIAFSEFEHANDLAESLFLEGDKGRRAWAAMKSIRHTAQNQSDWFVCCGNFLRARPPVWIIRQEAFEEDVREFIKSAGLGLNNPVIDFGVDDVKSHKNDYTSTPPLSLKAKENLQAWYVQDMVFYEMCESWIESGGSRRPFKNKA
jgi:hypothetical protein